MRLSCVDSAYNRRVGRAGSVCRAGVNVPDFLQGMYQSTHSDISVEIRGPDSFARLAVLRLAHFSHRWLSKSQPTEYIYFLNTLRLGVDTV